MNYRGALYLLTGLGDIVYPGLALDGFQCKAAQAGRGYEITAWGGWQDKREMRLAVYPLSSEKTLLSRLFFALWAGHLLYGLSQRDILPGRNPGYHTQILDRGSLTAPY